MMMRLLAFADFVGLSLLEFLGFAGIPVFDRAIVTRDTGIDFGFFSTNRALPLFAGEIAVILTNGIGGRDGVIRQFVVFSDFTNQFHAGFPVWQSLAKESVENGSRGIKGLETIFDI